MQNYLEHPDEEVLERFLLHQSGEEELEVVETHILACDSCVSRLEALEIEIAAMKLALQNVRQKEAAASVAARQNATGRSWFTLPKMSMAAGVAALALGFLIVPQLRKDSALPIAQVSLVANRGSETTIVPKGHPLHVVLNTNDLTQRQLDVQLVDANGTGIWKGTATVQNDRAAVDLPKISQAGEHYIRLYAPQSQGEPELLREFAIDVR